MEAQNVFLFHLQKLGTVTENKMKKKMNKQTNKKTNKQPNKQKRDKSQEFNAKRINESLKEKIFLKTYCSGRSICCLEYM